MRGGVGGGGLVGVSDGELGGASSAAGGGEGGTGGAAGGEGGGAIFFFCSSSSSARLNSSSTPLAAFLTSRINLPAPRANSGSFSPPNSTSTMMKTKAISPPPRPSRKASVSVHGIMGSLLTRFLRKCNEEICAVGSRRLHIYT